MGIILEDERQYAMWPDGAPSVATDTQIEALAATAPVQGEQRQRVYAALKVLGGATDPRLAEVLHLDTHSVRARRNELMDLGLVVDSGIRTVRQNGLRAIVWVVGAPDDTRWVEVRVQRKELLKRFRRVMMTNTWYAQRIAAPVDTLISEWEGAE